MKTLKVPQKYNNKKIQQFLQDEFPSISTNLFFKTLRKKDIRVNGEKINENITIYKDDEIVIYIPDDKLENNLNLDIVYDDDNIIIVNKPINIETEGENSITTILEKEYSKSHTKPMACHRLDRNTTGLLLFAKNEATLNEVFDAFKNHKIEKHYKALVYGVPKESKKSIISYLFKDKKKSLVYISDTMKKGYMKILTSYTVIKKYNNGTTLLDVEIGTGKTHQIRAELAHIGLPIIGDGKYGDYDVNKKFDAKTQKLTCYKLSFHFSKDSNLSYLNDKTFEI